MAPHRCIGSENAEPHRYVHGNVINERESGKNVGKSGYVYVRVRNVLNINREAEAYDAVQEAQAEV